MRGRFCQRGAQGIGREAGEIEKPLRAPLVLQHPAERLQRQSCGFFGRWRGPVTNCQSSDKKVKDLASLKLGGGRQSGKQ